MIVKQISNINSITFVKLGNYLTKLLLYIKNCCSTYLIEMEEIMIFLLEANMWDLLFSSFLHLSSFSHQGIFVQNSIRLNVGAILALLIIIGIFLYSTKVIPRNNHLKLSF